MKLTKIVATIGPACDNREKIKELILSEVDIFRFNLKHNTIDWHQEKINLVHQVAKELDKIVGILIDLQGPEIRFKLPFESINLKVGSEFLLSETGYLEKKGISFSHPQIINNLKENDQVLVDDGRFVFLVKKNNNKYFLISQSEGRLFNAKSVSIPHLKSDLPSLTEKDLEGLKLGYRVKVDFVALSFVRNGGDILNLKKKLKELKIKAQIVAKIETAEAIGNLNEIVKSSDGIMVARGDLGVEEPLIKVAYLQKEIIKKARQYLKPVITATQMLESMITNPFPTRAEISDITNSYYDGTDTTMLSAETANGKYPVKAVSYMRKTLSFIERNGKVTTNEPIIINKDQEFAVIFSAYNLYQKLEKDKNQDLVFLVFSQTGRTARILSAFRPRSPIFTVIPDEEKGRYLTLNYGIVPIYDPQIEKGKVTHEAIDKKIALLIKKGYLKKGLTLIILHGDIWGKIGGISTIRLKKI
mgnify:CR=1 FL=1